MYRFYRRRSLLPQDLARAQAAAGGPVEAEHCFYVQTARALDETHDRILRWLLAETFDPDGLATASFLAESPSVLEIGPRINFETAWCSTARSICHVNGLDMVLRLERSRRFGFGVPLPAGRLAQVAEPLHDRMTETIYPAPLTTFETGLTPEPVQTIPLAQGGLGELRRVNRELGLAMDEADLDRFYRLFTDQLHRDPTDVELFQLAQGNSEHCRHGFFKGRMIIDGAPQAHSLMSIVKEPWRRNPGNSLIAFHDDSSAIRGQRITVLAPTQPGAPAPIGTQHRIYHPTLTAETHNHPSGVAPYPGAISGAGGRIRDNQAVGRGGLVQVSGAAYCVGNLHLTDEHVWEADGHTAPAGLAAPLDILIQASNGASDYGNCFGEPLIYGFVRTFGARTSTEYRSWFKPVMYTAGAGQLDDAHIDKQPPEPGMLVVQLGGPAYRIGLGGGAASSMMSGENEANLDFNSVQRGDPELEQRLNRVLRACIELGDANPIVSAHDLGAGGDSNALPEIVHPAGARIELRAIPVGDASLSVLEIWGNESQERNAILIRPTDLATIERIATREKSHLAVVGEVTGDGRLILHDAADGSSPVDLPLEPILGAVAPKELHLETVPDSAVPLSLHGITIDAALDRVLRLPSVASKSYLTRKVDRCVTGHVAQQQCVGPNQLPLADYAVYAQSLFGHSGVALSLGEQPVKGLIDPAAMARMAVAEALLNLAGAKITQLPDIRCSANWMWAAKLPGEGAQLRRAAVAMSEIMIKLGIAVDGGKDSLSMAVTGAGAEPIKAPGQLVISAYAPMPDVRVKVTPDLKTPGNALILIDPSGGQARLGGSALAQVWQQLGDQTPDVDNPEALGQAFSQIQELIAAGRVVSAHDRSDGGLITAVAEMAFAGNTGLELDLDLGPGADPLAALFAEELGVVLETEDAGATLAALRAAGVPATVIGRVGAPGGNITVRLAGDTVIDRPMTDLRAVWEDTSTRIDRLQADPECVDEEHRATRDLVTAPNWRLTFTPAPAPAASPSPAARPRVAVLRDQGSNGDRELAAAFHAAGFEAWDVTMTDLLDRRISLDGFRGLAFPGGFSYGDVLDAGKGWAGIIRFHPELAAAFEAFYRRPDTFSLGVCNGAQLMALLGWTPDPALPDERRPRFIRNRSGRFECRLVTVEVAPSPSIFLRGMAGSRLGVWVAHGEGRLHLPEGAVDPALVPLRFADPDGKPTERYPFNPNGSPGGATALTSPDGRHLAMMPHPERMANQLWQWPWLPPGWRDLPASPWLRMFTNAFDWCHSAALKTEPSKTEPSKTEPSKTEPSKTEPSKTEKIFD